MYWGKTTKIKGNKYHGNSVINMHRSTDKESPLVIIGNITEELVLQLDFR